MKMKDVLIDRMNEEKYPLFTQQQFIDALTNINGMYSKRQVIEYLNEHNVDYFDWNDLECYCYYLKHSKDQQEKKYAELKEKHTDYNIYTPDNVPDIFGYEIMETIYGIDEIQFVFVRKLTSFYIFLHRSGKFSTTAINESEYGTLEECESLLDANFHEEWQYPIKVYWDIQEAFKNYLDAHNTLYKHWMAYEAIKRDACFGTHYPYHLSFDDIQINTWVETSLKTITTDL